METLHKITLGVLSAEILFKGSKSEREHAILTTEDDQIFRVYIIGENLTQYDLSFFNKYFGKRVKINGIVDEIRGHQRIGINSQSDIEII